MSIVNESKYAPISLIIDREHDWEVSVKDLKQLIALHVIEIKLALIKVYDYTHALFDFHILNVVFLIWGIHHSRHVIHVPLFCHACIDSQVSVNQGVYLEREL